MNSIWSQQFWALSAPLVQFIPVECRPEEAAETSKEKIKVFLVWWLLSWDRQCSPCLAGVEEIRDQWEILQWSLMGDTSVLHLKPGGEKWTWVKHKICTFLNILKVSFNLLHSTKICNTLQISKYSPPSSLPVSRGYDIVYRGWWGVSGCAKWLTQTVGPCLGEYEPVSDVELRQQTVLHYLVQVITRGTPQAAAEHWSIQGCVLLTHRDNLFTNPTHDNLHQLEMTAL